MTVSVLDMRSDAIIEGPYRYALLRDWSGHPHELRQEHGTVGYWHAGVCWVMLNPSTADHEVDDPTIRRCIQFTKRWGMSTMVVVNLYALRATNPKELRTHPDPIGPENEQWLREHMRRASCTIAAWGTKGASRQTYFEDLLAEGNVSPFCLGTTKGGHPRHPLYVKGDVAAPRWRMCRS